MKCLRCKDTRAITVARQRVPCPECVKALCQSCLRIHPPHPTNQGVCECGGGTCHCDDCAKTIAGLLDGSRNARELGLTTNLAFEWTPEGGIAFVDAGHVE